MKLSQFFLLSILFFSRITFCGFSPETLIKVHDGYVPIEQLDVGNIIVSFDLEGNYLEKRITHKQLCRQENCLCLIVDQKEIITSQNQKFFLAEEYLWKSARDLKIGDVLFSSYGNHAEIVEIIDIGQADLYEIAVEELHNFFVSEDEFLAHNFVAVAAEGIKLSYIIIYSAVPMIVGATIALKKLTPKLYNIYNEQRVGQVDVPLAVSENDSALIERYYFLERKKELETLKQDFASIVNGIQHLPFSKGNYFSSNFLGQISMQHANDFLATNTIVPISSEQQLNHEQRQQLRATRESELLQLEREIIRLQWLIAIHFNQLLELRDNALRVYLEHISQIDKAIDLWNSKAEPPKSVVFQTYEQDLLYQHLLENIRVRNNELQKVVRYYEASSSAKSYFEKSFKLAIQLDEIIKEAAEIDARVKQNTERATKNILIAEEYCMRNSINIANFKQNVINKLEKQEKERIKKELEKANQTLANAPPPKGPDDDEEEQEIKISEKDANHIFKNEPGHFPKDTPENRKLLLELVSNEKNFLGKSGSGSGWYGKVLSNGKQLWAEVRNGLIRNGGLNDIPKKFNPQTGLCRPFQPKFKI